MRPHYEKVLANLQLLYKLEKYQPVVIGTLPLGIDVLSSDIDVACTSQDFDEFSSSVREYFGSLDGFSREEVEVPGGPALCFSFLSQGWEIELFCQAARIDDQWGVRHFLVEQRLIRIDPRLKSIVTRLKQDGLKTEPAFAQAMKLQGDPYEAVVQLAGLQDSELAEMAATAIRN